MDKQLTRKELLDLAREKSLSEHIRDLLSDSDKELLEMLRDFPVQGKDSLVDAPAAFIQRAKNIMREQAGQSLVGKIKSLLVFDSWHAPGYVGVRGSATHAERRMRFEVGSLEIDVRGEFESGIWNFIAEIEGSEDQSLRLKSDKDIIASVDNTWFEWSCKKPPVMLSVLLENNQELKLPKVSWKRPGNK